MPDIDAAKEVIDVITTAAKRDPDFAVALLLVAEAINAAGQNIRAGPDAGRSIGGGGQPPFPMPGSRDWVARSRTWRRGRGAKRN